MPAPVASPPMVASGVPGSPPHRPSLPSGRHSQAPSSTQEGPLRSPFAAHSALPKGAESPGELARAATDPFSQYIAKQQAAHLEVQNPGIDPGDDSDAASNPRYGSPAISSSSQASTPMAIPLAHAAGPSQSMISQHPPIPSGFTSTVPPRPPPSGKQGGKRKKKGKGDGEEKPVCSHCGTATSPLFRRDPSTGNYICNVSRYRSPRLSLLSLTVGISRQACGLYFKAHGHHRPINVVARAIGPQRIVKRKAQEIQPNKNVTIFIDDTPKEAKRARPYHASSVAEGGPGTPSGGDSSGAASPSGSASGAAVGGPSSSAMELDPSSSSSTYQQMPQLTFQAPYNPALDSDYHSPPPPGSPALALTGVRATSASAALNGTLATSYQIDRTSSPFEFAPTPPGQLPSRERENGSAEPFDPFLSSGGAGHSIAATPSGVGAIGGAREEDGQGVVSFGSEVEFWEAQYGGPPPPAPSSTSTTVGRKGKGRQRSTGVEDGEEGGSPFALDGEEGEREEKGKGKGKGKGRKRGSG